MYRTKVEYDKDLDEYLIILPTELLEEMNLKEGDELACTVEDGKIYLSKNNS